MIDVHSYNMSPFASRPKFPRPIESLTSYLVSKIPASVWPEGGGYFLSFLLLLSEKQRQQMAGGGLLF